MAAHTHHHDAAAGHSAGHSADADRRWLVAALAVIVVFMLAEITAAVLAHSLALLTDAAHMLSDAGAIALALWAAQVARRPPRGRYTYGFARVEALAGQANGIVLLGLALWFTVEAGFHLAHPPAVHGAVVGVVAVLGAVMSALATVCVARADRRNLNIRGVFVHLLTDLWAFGSTALAGLLIVLTGWARFDALASLVVAVVMAITGGALVRDTARFFLDSAPSGVEPAALGRELAAISGVVELHDLHIWDLGAGATALSAHVLVSEQADCHDVCLRMREVLRHEHGIGHVTVQTDHLGHPGCGHGDSGHGDDHLGLSYGTPAPGRG